MNDDILKQLKDIPILCVEDEDGIREVIVKTLKYYFNEVYEANDADEGYEKYFENKPKIVLCDIQMKETSGIDLVKKIRQSDQKTAIIMLTAHSNEEYLMDLINLNISHFILKPLNHKKLTEALIKYINANMHQQIELTPGVFLDLSSRELIFKDEKVVLRKREKEFFHLLYQKKGATLTYYEIESELWVDKEMTSHALKSFIKELRAKLPMNIIKNVPQEGYTLI